MNNLMDLVRALGDISSNLASIAEHILKFAPDAGAKSKKKRGAKK